MEKGEAKVVSGKYEPVIGLEVHVELNTKSKMFCSCSTDYFGAKPNTHTCPVCLGLPGALPYINEEAIKKCLKIGLALNCTQNKNPRFERKNYFYPDLPKGYQISQLVLPININGTLDIMGDDGKVVKIRINRAHQEEDTGKLTHSGAETLVDLNRSGVPLVEIVTEPDFTDSSQIRDYAKKLQQIFRYLGVSNADMERGDMRLEANISVRRVKESESHDESKKRELPPYRVELKNINSFRFMVAAVEYEIKRQIEALEKGETLKQETRGWNEDKKETYLQRSKEEANDYRYFPEPDLPELEISPELVESIKAEQPELPWEKIKRWGKDYSINPQNGAVLADSKDMADFFDALAQKALSRDISAKDVANYLINSQLDLVDSSPDQIIDELIAKKSNVLEDEGEIEGLAKEVIDENPGMVEQYQGGKESVLQALIGGVMRKTSGKANSAKVKSILENLLKK